MPTYEYACRECGHHVEVVQRFTDDPLTTCGQCGGALRKVFSAAGIIFKGSGYYVTDSRSKSTSGSSGGSTSSDASSAADSSSASGSAGEGSSGAGSGSGSGEAKSA
jgi:putative FmdB family regulatory protein